MQSKSTLGIVRALNDHLYQVEDLRTGSLTLVHACQLKYYYDVSLDQTAILFVLTSKTDMLVARLMRLVKNGYGIYVQMKRKELNTTDNTLKSL